ncbi:MAG TPA: hypothetical protein VE779_16225 [Candidatus Angelobacter sp.]|nr:hypothetical protein [Candidatus Angelobacter sp.]
MKLCRILRISSTFTALAFSAVFALAAVAVSSEPAEAVVYCAAGVVRAGCVAHPVAGAAAVTPGVSAPGVGVRAGTPANRSGPVDRVGRR